MADGVFNIAKGRVAELHNRVNDNDPSTAGLVVVLLQATSQADATLDDYDTLAAVLASNTEATFTNYVRKVLTDSDITAAVTDDTNNRTEADIPDQVWSSAGGASNDTLDKLLICYDPDTTGGTDSAIVPLAHFDFDITTNGGDLTATINAAGYFRAS